MKLAKVERTYTVTKKELEELLRLKIKSMHCSDSSGMRSKPSYDLTIYTEDEKI